VIPRPAVSPGPRGARRAPRLNRPSGLRPPPPSAAMATYTRALLDLNARVADEVDVILRAAGLMPERTDAAADGDGPAVAPDAVARAQRQLAELRERMLRGEKNPLATLDVVASRVTAHSGRAWQAALARLGVKIADVQAPHLEHLRSLWQHRNLDLIKSLPLDHVDRVRDVLNEMRGARVEDLAKRIAETTDATEARARLIARDQTLKLNAEITEARHRAAGVVEYIWRASRDERTRERHKELDGTRQRYAMPPVVDERTGRRANPGDDYQCRCIADPVLPGIDD